MKKEFIKPEVKTTAIQASQLMTNSGDGGGKGQIPEAKAAIGIPTPRMDN